MTTSRSFRAAAFALAALCLPFSTPSALAVRAAPGKPPRAPATSAPWETSGIDWSQPPAPAADARFVAPKPVSRRLKNGAKVLVIENHRLPIASVEVLIADAGSAQDPAGKGGLAALTADLVDEGAGERGALALSAEVERLGASLDAGVDAEGAVISLEALSRNLRPSIMLLGDVIARPRFDEADGKRVLEDRKTELELRPDEPRILAALLLWQVLYGPRSAYGHPHDGLLGEADKLTIADAKAFHAARWSPTRMTIVVVGDVDVDTVTMDLESAFAGWQPKGSSPLTVRAQATRPSGRLFIVDRPGSEQADVRLGLVSIAPRDPRGPALDVLATALGGTFTSRLNRRLREELGWTYGARARVAPIPGPSPFVISTALVTEHAVEGVAEVLKILESMVTADLPADELAKARENLIRELPQLFGSTSGMAHAFGALVSLGLPLDTYAGYPAKIAKVSAAQVRGVAKAFLGGKKLVVVVVGDAKLLRPGLEQLLGPATMVDASLIPGAAGTF